MEGWLISLALTLVMSLGAWVPGLVDARLTEELNRAVQQQLGPEVSAVAHVEGDPLLQLPWGVVPRLKIKLNGVRIPPMPLEEVRIELDDVHVNGLALYAKQPPRLLAPAPTRFRVRVARAELQARLEREVAKLKPEALAFELPLLGKVTPQLEDVQLKLEDGRVTLAGQVRLKPGAAPRPFAASVALMVEGTRKLVVRDARLSLANRTIPGFLLAPLLDGVPPLFALDDLDLPAGDWRLAAPHLDAEGIELGIDGTLTDFSLPQR